MGNIQYIHVDGFAWLGVNFNGKLLLLTCLGKSNQRHSCNGYGQTTIRN